MPQPRVIGSSGVDVLVGSCEAAAVGDRPVGAPNDWKLLLPGAQVAEGAVDEYDRPALALLAVGKARSVDVGCLGTLEPGARHLVSFASVRQMVKRVASRRLGAAETPGESHDNEGLYN